MSSLSATQNREFHVLSELQNATIEERVTLLETQVEIVNDAIADIEDDVDNLEVQVTVLFGDQVIQDEQLLELGTTTESMYKSIFVFQFGFITGNDRSFGCPIGRDINSQCRSISFTNTSTMVGTTKFSG